MHWNVVVIIMEICKVPIFKALNKHNIKHLMCIMMENVICNLTKVET